VINYGETWNTVFFEKALVTNRPAFVDYFLRRQHDVLETREYIEFNHNRENKIVQEIVASLRPINLSSRFDIDQVTTQPNNNEYETSFATDVAENETDDANVRAAFGRKFVIKKLYEKTNDHIEV
jgi:hypothetical protein